MRTSPRAHEEWAAYEMRLAQSRMLRAQAIESLRRDEERRRFNRRLLAVGVFFFTFMIGVSQWL